MYDLVLTKRLIDTPYRHFRQGGVDRRDFNFYTSGSRNKAAALGFILLILGAVCLFTINKIAGASKMGGVFG